MFGQYSFIKLHQGERKLSEVVPFNGIVQRALCEVTVIVLECLRMIPVGRCGGNSL